MFKIIRNPDLDNYLCMKYFQITSVDVERSFFVHKNILSPNRHRFAEDSLSKNMIVTFFFITNQSVYLILK
jgi:hypothetical protein